MEVGKFFRSTHCHIPDVRKLHHWNGFPFDTTSLLCYDDDDDEYLENRDSEVCARLRLQARVNFGKTGFECRRNCSLH